jgi:signal transduction histidine kinase
VGTEPLASPELADLREARARHQARLRWSRPIATALVAAVDIVITAIGQPRPGIDGASLLVSAALAGLVVGLATSSYAQCRLPRLTLAGAALQFGSGAALFWLQPHGTAGLAGIGQALVFAAGQLRRRPVALAAVLGTALLVLMAEASRSATPLASAARYGPFVAVCLLVVLFQRLRDAKEHAETLLEQLAESRGAQARAAALAERQRLAREMHDVLAHSLSGLMLQLEGARMLATASPADPRLPEVVGRAHELARDGLDEARRAIGMLRGEEMPGPLALGTLTSQFEKHSGIPCSFGTLGRPSSVRPDARLALYRVTQEALTNVIRHANAERVEVCLAYAPGRVSLSIEDHGPGPAPAGNGAGPEAGNAGHGLTGMRERAELLGGTLTTGATSAGFRVELRIPA